MSKLLIVGEGATEIPFFEVLAGKLGLSSRVEVTERGGKDKNRLKSFLKEYLSFYYDSKNCSRMLVVRDCDGKGAQSAVQSMQDSLDSVRKEEKQIATLLDRMQVDFLVIPHNLEDLLLQVLKHPEVKPCLDNFIKCLQERNIKDIPKKVGKTCFLAYLASMKEPTDRLDKRFVYEQFINLEHPALDFIKEKILVLLK